MLWLLCPGSTVSTEYSTGGSIVLAVALLVRTAGKWSSIAKTSFPFLSAAVANFLAVLHYTHSTTNYQNLTQQYTPCGRNIHPRLSNILPTVATAGVYAIYDCMQHL